jgi:hypothetical protein
LRELVFFELKLGDECVDDGCYLDHPVFLDPYLKRDGINEHCLVEFGAC